MLKKLFLPAMLGALVTFSACEEKGPIIDFGTNNSNDSMSADTTYVAAVPAVQQRYVLVEEFTGAKCANCPDARVLLANLSKQNGNRVLVMGIHIFNFVQSEPVHNSKYDFRTQDGTDIGNTVYSSIIGMPVAGIDRTPNLGGEMQLLKNEWAAIIGNRIAKEPGVNMDVESSFDAATRKATIKVKIAYPKAMTGQQYLSVAIIEDDLVDKQDSIGTVIEEYDFKHTLRDFITPTGGVPFLQNMADKEAGRVYERRFVYDVKGEWKPENCQIIAFVHKNDGKDKEVLQAAETHLVK